MVWPMAFLHVKHISIVEAPFKVGILFGLSVLRLGSSLDLFDAAVAGDVVEAVAAVDVVEAFVVVDVVEAFVVVAFGGFSSKTSFSTSSSSSSTSLTSLQNHLNVD